MDDKFSGRTTPAAQKNGGEETGEYNKGDNAANNITGEPDFHTITFQTKYSG